MANYYHWDKGIRRIYLSRRPNTPTAQTAEDKIAKIASDMGIDVVHLTLYGQQEKIQKQDEVPSVMISLGGDGTLLRTRMKLGNNSIPFISINYGGLGALSELEAEELDKWLLKIISGDFFVEERCLLSTAGKTALNEVLLKSASVGKSITVTLYVDDHYLFKARADGIIIATPTGSSAYAFSAGGPLVDPSLDAMVVVPVAPFFWGIRPFVTNNSELKITAQGNSTLVVDGEETQEQITEISVKISSERARFVRLKPFSFANLYRKLESRLV
ncbi:MAG: NAD(+)/NADH kinase [Thermoprotei archaeon]